jgi:predicted RNA binding protein YcfA (HicA-like mRNA interferase family)
LKFRDFIKIIEANGFAFARFKDTHHFYRGIVDGRLETVNCDYNHLGDDIPPRNLASMIRQSKLPKRLFRQ